MYVCMWFLVHKKKKAASDKGAQHTYMHMHIHTQTYAAACINSERLNISGLYPHLIVIVLTNADAHAVSLVVKRSLDNKKKKIRWCDIAICACIWDR